MNSRIRHLINHPFEVQLSDVALLQDEIEKYPYFSTLRVLLLFGLKEYDHSSYREELKKTSIHCPSRVALYYYLQKERQESTEARKPEEIVAEPITEIPAEEKVLMADEPQANPLLAEETTTQAANPETTEKLDLAHSEFTFSEWLSISRSKSGQSIQTPSEKDIKFQLIDEFIEKSPKISPVNKSQESNISFTKSGNSSEYSDLMTETLAQIYTEQKKYEKAIRAYKILSLKYPEKSDFFEDKIKEMEHLRDSK